MSQRLSAIYTNGASNTDYNINAYIKVKFGADNIRMMLVQPIYNPSLKKRCILISPRSLEVNIDNNENLIISYSNDMHLKDCNINIFNILGEKLYSKNNINLGNTSECQINLKYHLYNIPTGILICHIDIGGMNKSIKFMHKSN